ncbi:DNA-binding protein [Nostoc sp. RF31YmG]|nr:DNA-binding protein [Nostoc sp. RF31YmG]
MNIDLLGYRQKIGISQAEVANTLDISKIKVELYEQAPDTVPMGLLVQWLQILGVDLATAMSAPIPPLKGINPGTPYAELYRRLNLLDQYIEATPPIEKLDIPTPPATPHDLQQRLKLYKQKPNVVLTGGFDAGKSHLANALLGSKNLPVGYQPATRVITFVRHVEDRPEWFKEDVLIFDEEFWLKDESGKQRIDFLLLDDKERCEKYYLQSGSLHILQKYGVHGSSEDIAAHAAVVYLDSPLLKACNLIDLPGYSDQPDEVSKDVEKANSATQIADILLYASPAKGHINGSDMIRLGSLLRLLPTPENECSNFPTLGNFFIVATHADPSISDHQLTEILDKAPRRLYNNLSETVIERRRKNTNRAITEAELRQRFFTFWSEKPDRCQQLFDELTRILGEFFPKARLCRFERDLIAIKEDNTKKYASLIDIYVTNLTNIELQNLQRSQLQEIEKNEYVRKQEDEINRDKVRKKIDELKKNTIIDFQRYTEQLLNVDAVEAIIRRKYHNQREAQEYLAGYLVEKLQNELENLIKANSEKFKIEIDTFFQSYPKAEFKGCTVGEYTSSTTFHFDWQASVMGAVAGLGSFGALAAWAISLGNLGGYIIVAKFVSFLSAIGIGFGFSGGTAGIMTLVAAIGGPIVFGIGLSVTLGLAVANLWSSLTESWQKRLARESVKNFEKQKVSEQFPKAIDKFWQDTANGFEKVADVVEGDWNKHLEHLRALTSPQIESKERTEQILRVLEILKSFFAGLPDWNINEQC